MKSALTIKFVNYSFRPTIRTVGLEQAQRQFSEAAREAVAAAKPLEVYANGIPANMPKHRDVGVPANPFAGDNGIHRCRESHLARTGRRY